MPIYEYECDDCLHQFELKQSFNDDSAVACPQCDSTTRRIFSSSPIIFKGSGFYITDVKRAGEKTDKQDAEKDSSKKEAAKKDSSEELAKPA